MIDHIDIIITTRNRVSELETTLDKVLEAGFISTQIYIVDDASTDGTKKLLAEKYAKIEVLYNHVAKGYIANRNYLMHNTTKPYILSLDDDSCFMSATDVEEAIQLLERNEAYGIFTFNTFEQIEEPPVKERLPKTVRQVRSYIGCGHIIKREVINKLGNYVEAFEFYCEELDYSLRAWKLGYNVITQDNLVVHHRIDWEKRHKQFESDVNKGVYGAVWRSILGFSNNLLVVKQYYPKGLDMVFSLYYMLLRFWNFFIKKGDYRGYWGGILRFYRLRNKLYESSNKLKLKTFIHWINLPVR